MTLLTPKPPDLNPWSPITDVCRPDRGVMQSSVWRKDLSYRSPAHSDIMERKGRTRKNSRYVHHYGFLFLRTGISHLQPLTASEAFIISRNSVTVFYTTLRTHFASNVQHPPLYPPILFFKGMKLKEEWSFLSAVRVLKINKERKLEGNCLCGLKARHTQ